MKKRTATALHHQFLRSFFRIAKVHESEVRTSGAAAWTDHASVVLHAVQSELELYCACSHPTKSRHLGERREWLWDLSWYATTGARYDPPLVVIEHENSHSDAQFMDDFWKILAAHAPLRVMIGYTGRRVSLLDRRIAKIHDTASAWVFPQHATDIVILRRYGHPSWDILLRENGQPSFTQCQEETWA